MRNDNFEKIKTVLFYPYFLWFKQKKASTYDNLRNGLLLYILYTLMMAGEHQEADLFPSFLFNRMLLFIFLVPLFISPIFFIYSYIVPKGLVKNALLFCLKQCLSLPFFSLSALTIAASFFSAHALIHQDGAYIRLLEVIFMYILAGSYLYGLATWSYKITQQQPTSP